MQLILDDFGTLGASLFIIIVPTLKMGYGRPLLYMSLPGLAFILGVLWFRRRCKNLNDKKDESESNTDTYLKNGSTGDHAQLCPKNSIQNFMPIITKPVNIAEHIYLEEQISAPKIFGKSAPIKIQNSRNTFTDMQSLQQQDVDCQTLNSRIKNTQHKIVNCIDESFDNHTSQINLPDSCNYKSPLQTHNKCFKYNKPIIIKANISPKISPESSFIDSNYIEYERKNCNVLGSSNNIKVKDTVKQTGKKVIHNKRCIEACGLSISICSDHSGDSGKGSSLPRPGETSTKLAYEFFLPKSLFGKLSGHHGSFITKIKTKTAVNIQIRKNRFVEKLGICIIEGSENEINEALMMIRNRLPQHKYPNFTMERIHYALPQTIVPLSTQSLFNLQLYLIEGINNDVLVSAVVTSGHIFVQHPLHPSNPHLIGLQKCLLESYSTTEAPPLPGIEISAVCVMSVNGMWYRVQITDREAENENRCIIKFLDFGGYMNVNFHELRQIRSDFMLLPFQATECVLSNIEPKGFTWSKEGADILCKLTRGIVLQAQVAGYNSHNIPEIYLFACLGPNNIVFINKELVARNLAKWVELRY
ncbi:A-kinase anchor protein 1, mitochondrial [Teleopsis dalmanni]|uniref:A-kinase anchor protein 1, mitochondrial n=1 Tax=Teleopsis dalmanni TaxID=139649 RepID=UPI0018CF1675|nr:A-kinase anchor protein 1, mitochondrial [Teleopsis dalmanni]